LLLRCHPEWAIHPVAVVTEDKPQGLIRWINSSARKAGVRPGLRYAAGCSLAADLRAGVVPPTEINGAAEAIIERLRRFTPEIEPSAEEPGVFWLNGAGLTRLYPSYEAWARLIAADLNGVGFRATVVVGFTRFGTYAVARAQNGTVALNDPVDERAAIRQVRLECLEIDPDLRDTLAKLGVTTVGAFLALPAGGLLTRFDEAAYRLHRMASGELWTPLQPLKPQESIRQRLLLDNSETDAMRLLFRIKGLLHPLLKALAVRGEALAGLTLRLQLDGGEQREEQISPAAPTLDPVQLLDLIRLRLEIVELPNGVVEIELEASSVLALAEQHRLIVERPRRDLEAANRALARIRTTFGDEAVGRVRLADAHLPEANFRWEPLKQGLGVRSEESGGAPETRNPKPETKERSLVRRIFAKPVPLRLPPGSTLHGPYIVSGGWWGRDLSACGHAQAGTHRDYYFAETRHGELLWVYYDPHRSRWFLHGTVE
ncbi:DNA polymerase Y family protein, partial [Candidatus Methylomirabilis sp.]